MQVGVGLLPQRSEPCRARRERLDIELFGCLKRIGAHVLGQPSSGTHASDHCRDVRVPARDHLQNEHKPSQRTHAGLLSHVREANAGAIHLEVSAGFGFRDFSVK